MSWNELACLIKMNKRTLRDWRREKYAMSFSSAQTLSKKFNIPIPSGVKIRDWGSHLKEASIKGGTNHYKKYGRVKVNEEKRKLEWQKWWKSEGRFKKHPLIGVRKKIYKPRKSAILAEFSGIVLGDGGISKRQVVITLDREKDREYTEFVYNLVSNLFKVPVGKYLSKRDRSIDLVISRTELVDFCTGTLGLKKGNKIKHQVDIPDWIKCDKNYSTACVRGLVDTDGSVFTHKYFSSEKYYSYNKISFTSGSRNLRQSVQTILKRLGIRSRLHGKFDVRIESQRDVERYIKVVGSHNSKHLYRYNN